MAGVHTWKMKDVRSRGSSHSAMSCGAIFEPEDTLPKPLAGNWIRDSRPGSEAPSNQGIWDSTEGGEEQKLPWALMAMLG